MPNAININYFQKAAAKDKARIQEFYGNVLGWERKEVSPDLDIFSFDEKSTYGIQYSDDEAEWLEDKLYEKSTWMSLRTDEREALLARIKDFGVNEFPEQSNDRNYFFQAPGGQVYVV